MKIRFNPRACIVAVVLLVVLALLATVGAHWGWIRSFLGDTLAVVWVYYCLKTVLSAHVLTLSALAFGMGALVELGQYAASHVGWRLSNTLLRIILGSTADWWDVLAYALGWLLVLLIEIPLQRRAQGRRGSG